MADKKKSRPDDCRYPEKGRLEFLAEDTCARDRLWNVQTESAQDVLRSDRKRSEQMVEREREREEREARDGRIRSTITYHQPMKLLFHSYKKGGSSILERPTPGRSHIWEQPRRSERP